MKIKTFVLAALLSLGMPFAAKAEIKNTASSVDSSCGAECLKLDGLQTNDFSIFVGEEDDIEIAQRSRRRRRNRSFKKIYLGGTLGLFFPSELEEIEISDGEGGTQAIDPGTGFGGNIYGGYKFNKLIGADLELLVFGGGAEPRDSAYASVAFFTNARFTFEFNKDSSKSPYAYISPGLGVAGVGFDDEIGDRLEDDAGAGFALQVKGGVGFPLSDLIDIYGQVRYFNAFQVYEVETRNIATGEVTDSEDQGFSSLGLEVGINFKL